MSRNDVCDVSGKLCPICLSEIGNGDPVYVLSCGGDHFLCTDCHHNHEAYDRQIVDGTHANTMFELVRRNEGALICPVCRRMSHVATEAVAQNYYPGSGNTAEDPVEIID